MFNITKKKFHFLKLVAGSSLPREVALLFDLKWLIIFALQILFLHLWLFNLRLPTCKCSILVLQAGGQTPILTSVSLLPQSADVKMFVRLSVGETGLWGAADRSPTSPWSRLLL